MMTTLLIHSLGTDRSMWSGQLGPLGAERRVIAVDLPGHGRSSASPGPFTIEDLGSDILDLARESGVERFEVVGVSLGGLIALWLAAFAGDRVEALVAANTSPRLGSHDLWARRIEAVEVGGMDAIKDTVVRRFFAPDYEADHPDEFSHYCDVFLSTDPDGYIACCAALRDADLTDELSAIKSPTLIIGGELDVAAPPEQSIALHEAISGSRLEVIAGAGHLSNVDHSELFNRALGDFLGLGNG